MPEPSPAPTSAWYRPAMSHRRFAASSVEASPEPIDVDERCRLSPIRPSRLPRGSRQETRHPGYSHEAVTSMAITLEDLGINYLADAPLSPRISCGKTSTDQMLDVERLCKWAALVPSVCGFACDRFEPNPVRKRKVLLTLHDQGRI